MTWQRVNTTRLIWQQRKMDDGADPGSEIFMGVSPPSRRSHRPTSGMIDPSTLASLSRGSCQLIISSSGPRPPGVYSFVWARGGPGLFLAMITHLWPNFQPSPGLSPRITAPLLIIPCPAPVPPCVAPQLFFLPPCNGEGMCNAHCTAVLPPLLHCLEPGCSQHSLRKPVQIKTQREAKI